MGLSEKLTEIKSEITSLLAFANDTTKVSDTRLGDAIRTLADGFGQGGGGLGFVDHGEIVKTNNASVTISEFSKSTKPIEYQIPASFGYGLFVIEQNNYIGSATSGLIRCQIYYTPDRFFMTCFGNRVGQGALQIGMRVGYRNAIGKGNLLEMVTEYGASNSYSAELNLGLTIHVTEQELTQEFVEQFVKQVPTT